MRDRIIEVMARELFQRFRIEEADAPSVTWEEHAIHAHHHAAYVAAALAALTAYESHLQAEGMAVVPGWQPIETKPNDHFPALVWSEKLGQVVGFLDVTWTWWPCPAIEPLSSAPTHWRPLLPASPYGKAVVKEKDDE